MPNIIDITKRIDTRKKLENDQEFLHWIADMIKAGEIIEIIGVATTVNGKKYALTSEDRMTKTEFKKVMNEAIDESISEKQRSLK